MSLTGDDLKHQGMQQAAASNALWMDKAKSMIEPLLKDGEEIMGEDIRLRLIGAGLPLPSTPNAWGSLVTSIRYMGLIHETGEFRKPNDPTSHSSRKAVYLVFKPALPPGSTSRKRAKGSAAG